MCNKFPIFLIHFQILLKSRDSQIQEIGDELSNIHAIVRKEIETVRKQIDSKSKKGSKRKEQHPLAFSSSSTESVDNKESTVPYKKLEKISKQCANNNKTKYFNDDYVNGMSAADDNNNKNKNSSAACGGINSNNEDDHSILDSSLMKQFYEKRREIFEWEINKPNAGVAAFDVFDNSFLNFNGQQKPSQFEMEKAESEGLNRIQLQAINDDVMAATQPTDNFENRHFDYSSILRAFGE